MIYALKIRSGPAGIGIAALALVSCNQPSSLVFLTFLLVLGCSATPSEPSFEREEPAHATTSDALSSISCSESTDTGYTSGTPFTITVVKVDGKKVEKATANAYYVMAQAAAAAGVNIAVVSGFRTMEEQQALYSCYINCNCNNCNLAAKPGYSNHQSGHALDLNTSAGGVLSWLNANGAKYGFKRTVSSEPWHWEWWGGGPGGGPCGGGGAELTLTQMGTLDGTLSSDIDGDGTADICARSSKGITCYASGDGFVAPITGPALSNESGWDETEHFGTIRMGDVNGDGKADVCARAAAGMFCWLSDGTGFPEKIAGPEWSDASGWNKIQYWSTIRLADIDGDGMADLCARSSKDFRCHLSTGTGFAGAAIIGPALSNESGWNHDYYYGTIRMADVNGDGKADVCARSSVDFKCWLSDGAGFPDKLPGPALSNDSSWNEVQYWSTLRMPDVNGDGKADLCGRAAAGLVCWLSDGETLSEAITGPELSDEKGWDKVQYYSTLRFADLDADGKDDVCARAGAGLRCWLSDGNGFPKPIVGDMMSDENGWNKQQFYSTFRLSDANGDGRADACARAASGVLCWHFDGTAFGSSVAGPAWKDESGWNKFMYYSTLQIAGGCVVNAESCNQADDDCDGEIDEGGVCDTPGTGGVTGGGGTGGSGGAVSSSGGSSSNLDPAGESDDAGCGCRTTRSPTGSAALVALLGLGALFLGRRRSAR